ncbi:hypothetical protein HYT92_03050 [Candidatus Pacearchaeota archaeon]|nr:hypothetical protein [Candidatus Pacearchaeota archaeon]
MEMNYCGLECFMCGNGFYGPVNMGIESMYCPKCKSELVKKASEEMSVREDYSGKLPDSFNTFDGMLRIKRDNERKEVDNKHIDKDKKPHGLIRLAFN